MDIALMKIKNYVRVTCIIMWQGFWIGSTVQWTKIKVIIYKYKAYKIMVVPCFESVKVHTQLQWLYMKSDATIWWLERNWRELLRVWVD